jgi:hypothetical protein
MRARWKLGRLLAAVERGTAGRPRVDGNADQAGHNFRGVLEQIGLANTDAVRAQRIGALPEPELEKALAAAHRDDSLASFSYLLKEARPYWYAASRKAKPPTFDRQTRLRSMNAVPKAPQIATEPLLDSAACRHYKIIVDRSRGIIALAQRAAAHGQASD